MSATITLILGTIEIPLGSLTIPFAEGTYPREQIGATGVSFSAYGTAATDGTSHESPHIWNLVVRCKQADADRINRLCAKSAGQKLDVTIVDRTDRYWELPPRTRAIVPSGTEVEEDGMVGYHAQFKGRFTAPIKQVSDGAYRQISIQITETSVFKK